VVQRFRAQAVSPSSGTVAAFSISHLVPMPTFKRLQFMVPWKLYVRSLSAENIKISL